ncbi:conserved hypothetical membrane protein [Xanthobacter versatilis]|uniref:Conserved hypothetical membrane protein n=1 Tax=Xanthobacter autotrophicus (strain ATCC BAA-1158 / Py2) TaxID=78245 RepID=A7IHL0_XANP2|nr:conserved hypothetical membrane protein [Xanthobacter autotrophicus Py2]
MNVVMKNPRTGELKAVKVGFSWILFLFSSVFGLPLFLRKLYMLGGFMAGWRVLAILVSLLPIDPAMRDALTMTIFVGDIGLMIWLGLKGNELTAKNLLDHGWIFAKPESLEAQYAMSRWKIELPAAQAPQPAASL